ncbi:major capsid protein [Endozoicomonas sp. GU-1]|uniref:major capsid protein n=1 Tax=Endozoicomonas sp. GU-1 TaxID=3009078 RepID=UPI0022B33E68|nr:major capsid protein [Endozoicomonas sp. GU-1]WBA79559.1 major capsid protein [Endozoicomonas sp. GU-1]
MATLHTFNRQVRETATEMVDQEVQKFNEASGGALVIGNASVIGDYIEQASWQVIGGLVQRRNAYGSGAVDPVELNQLLDRAIKIDGRIGPVKMTDTLYRRIGSGPEEVASIVSAQAAEGMIRDYLNTTASALKTAIGTVADLKHDVAAATHVPMTLSVMNQGNAKMGDRSGQIAAYLMHSVVWHELIGEALDNTERLYSIGDIGVFDSGLGRRYVVSDIPALIESNKRHTLALVPGAAAVQVTGLTSFITEEKTGDENIQRMMQGEYEFVLGLKGFQWSKTTVKSPTDVQITTAANWVKVATSHKDCAGVLITTGKTA